MVFMCIGYADASQKPLAGINARTVNAILAPDVTAPVITLNGEANITLTEGDVYEELGATATDDVDGNVSVHISGDVNTSTVGMYIITYTASDSSGNNASVSRTVNVESSAPTLESLVLSTENTKVIIEKDVHLDFYYDADIPLKVLGTYSDGHSEEVTDQVTWSGLESAKYILADSFKAPVGVYTFKGSLNGVESNEVSVEVIKDTGLMQYDITYDSSEDEISIMVTTIDAPKEDINFTITIDENDKAAFPYHVNNIMKQSHTFEFKKDVVDSDQFTTIKILDTNMTTPITVVTHPMQSKDANYANIDLEDIVLSRVPDFTLDAPRLQERRGAIRGVTIKFRVWSKQYGLKYALVNPPKGMKITGRADEGMTGRDGRTIQWDIPMDAQEGKIYDITVKATDFRVNGKEKTITFPIKVPKTTPIQTTIVNNELTVTDKSSNLYGMKMKGHRGEDISELRLRSVEYRDVWKKRVENRLPEDVVKQTMFILDNMPKKLDMKMPTWMDTYDKARILLVSFSQYSGNSIHNESWVGSVEGLIRYENDDGYLYKRGNNKIRNIFMLMPTKAQYLGDDYE